MAKTKSKIVSVLIDGLIYAVYFFGSCLCVMIVESMLVALINKFVLISVLTKMLIRIIVYSLGVPALVGFLGYKEGYRNASCAPGQTLASGMLAGIPHVLFATLFEFHPFISGPVRFTVGIIRDGAGITETSVLPNFDIYWLFLVVFFGYCLIYSVSLTLCKIWGCRKRLLDRAVLTSSQKSAD